MQPTARALLELAIDQGALRFGEFTLKSGRTSPYFFNLGAIDHGAALARLGRCYADALVASGIECDMLFGPAYKGIVLAAATAMALAEHHGRDVPFAYNRKEAKDHGEGGVMVGAPLAGRVLVIDDVMTAGTAVREALALVNAASARPAGVLVALDRAERSSGTASAGATLAREAGTTVTAIANFDDLLALIQGHPQLASHAASLIAHRQRHGAGI